MAAHDSTFPTPDATASAHKIRSQTRQADFMADSETVEAYILIWDGISWRDVVRLRELQIVTIGRSTSNKIILQDESCSRNHCEIFSGGGEWRLRDLDSRNGTLLGSEPVSGDVSLTSGDVVAIGKCRLAFTTDLESQPKLTDAEEVDLDRETSVSNEEPDILHRTLTPGFLTTPDAAASQKELARLYRLGLEMGAARTRQELTEIVLDSIVSETVAEISAVLLSNRTDDSQPAPADLQVMAYESRGDLPYRRVSDNLSRIVLSRKEAVLARDVDQDQQLAVFDSLGEMRAASVICVPIHCDDRVRGLIHMYASNPDNPLDKLDLEFTLALARQLALALDHLRERESLQTGLDQARSENRSLRRQLGSDVDLIGCSEPMVKLKDQMDLIAETDANVLIRGESGCGKELIARSIHLRSPRREGPFVCLNCAALNESLLESELFGHEKGAFTGATERKIGRFEQADEGTLFLDEVGEMSPAIQAKFLRVLEGHPFERVGGSKPVTADVRLLAATNRNLEEAVDDGEFRKDLYFRLHVAELIAQPLRERKDDIGLLAEFFLQKFVEKTGRLISGFTSDAIGVLRDYSWPGNVRELQNTIERTVILCRNEVVRAEDIQLSTLSSRLATPTSEIPMTGYQESSLGDVERQHILSTLDHTEWNKSRAAQILGIERSTLDRKLKRYHVSRPD